MALASTDALVNIPTNIVVITLGTIRSGVNPYNWDDVHFDFGRVDLYPAVYWQADRETHSMIEATRWSVVICGLLFFAFFGFGDEAQRHYKLAYSSISKKLGITTGTDTTKIGTSQGTTSTFTGTQTGSSFGNKLIGGITSFKFSGLRSTGGGEENRKQTPIYISQEIVERRDSLDSFRSELTEIKTDYAPSERGVSPYPAPYGLNEHSSASLAPPRGRRASVPSSVTPTGSFLDLDDTKDNFNRV